MRPLNVSGFQNSDALRTVSLQKLIAEDQQLLKGLSVRSIRNVYLTAKEILGKGTGCISITAEIGHRFCVTRQWYVTSLARVIQ